MRRGNNIKKSSLPLVYALIAVIIVLFSLGQDRWNAIYRLFGLNDGIGFSSSEGVSVHFIDVGQGDCTLIITPDNSILIDSGERDYSSAVINYLKLQNVKKLDYIIVSHPHSDHMGGMSFIIDEFGADKIIMPNVKEGLVPTTSAFERMVDSILDSGTEIIYAKPQSFFEFGNGARLEIIAPVNDYDGLNNYSIVARFSYAGNSFLFTGDIEQAAEEDIIDSEVNIEANVLKVSHHGSKTSSSARFLNAINGEYAVICVGSPNSYNHPNDGVVNRILSRGYEILRTDLYGNIVFDCTSEGLHIYTLKGADR